MSKLKMDNLETNETKSKKLSKKLLNPKHRYKKKKMFEHWQKIPVIKEIPEHMPANLVQQEIRSVILDILRKGIKEHDELTDSVLIRHVFSAKELNKLINENLNKKIKISNVYFHLNALKEKSFIEIVTSIKEGRQIIHFYGRTARLFLWTGEAQDKVDNSIYPYFSLLLKSINSDLKSEEIQTLYKSLLQTNQESHKRVKSWMEQNNEILTNINIDTRVIYKLLKSVDSAKNAESKKINDKIARLLNFPIS